jgi:hypothetical protein
MQTVRPSVITCTPVTFCGHIRARHSSESAAGDGKVRVNADREGRSSFSFFSFFFPSVLIGGIEEGLEDEIEQERLQGVQRARQEPWRVQD